MSSKWRYILGTVTIVAITGGTIYAIKKSKDMEKTEEIEISLDEAKDIVARGQLTEDIKRAEINREFNEVVDTFESTRRENGVHFIVDGKDSDDMVAYAEADIRATRALIKDLEELDMEEIKDEIRDTASVVSFMRKDVEENEDVYYTADGDMFIEDAEEAEEDGELRYEPSSKEARQQFIKMELAEWRPLEDTYQTMLKLFDFPFNPKNDGDELMRTQIIDYRVDFFGFGSRWAKEVTIADVILHYARSAEFNCGESVRYWVEYFLEFNELDFTMSVDDIDHVIRDLNSHTYFNEERATFGLFGLTRESMDQAIKIANRNIDSSVTYEIEFNEFLKSCL